eukprot:1959438-Lingulodinium_polyedra.AAC.1
MNEEQMREFVQTVAAARQGVAPDEWFTNMQRAVSMKGTGELAIWEPWRQVAARTGEEELKAM